MKYLVASTFLNSHKMLEQYWAKGFLSLVELQSLHFVGLQSDVTFKPEHHLKNAMSHFLNGSDSHSSILSNSLLTLSEMLKWKGRSIFINYDEFETWQETILSVSPLVLLSYKIYRQSVSNSLLDVNQLVFDHFQNTAIPSVYEPQLEALCQEGLVESHMHLNGTTEPDFVWQDALKSPTGFYRKLKDTINITTVNEQYWQLGQFKQEDLYRLLKRAAHLRDQIIRYFKTESLEAISVGHSMDSCVMHYADNVHPYRSIQQIDKANEIQYESLFLIRVFSELERTQSTSLAFYLHYYLLIQSFFHKLLVQQRFHVGFDQFQKITLNELREYTEERYQKRFNQLHGMHENHLGHLEGRFAPKQTRAKHEKIMSAIQKGFGAENEQPFSLSLVTHFVKEKDKRKSNTILSYRDTELRLKTKRALAVLLDSMRKENSFLKQYIVGFDAASNELHASPEVFAPIYRKLKYLGYKNFTYHAGEDFVHLISGIRAVYEAVVFLELPTGSRIGHATALGIEPKLWAKRTGDCVFIEKGEWLDNLVFMYDFCRKYNELSGEVAKLEQSILQLFNEIYQLQAYYSIQSIIEAYALRRLDPAVAFGWETVGFFDGFNQQEVDYFKSANDDAQLIYKLYHQSGCLERSRKLIEVKLGDLISSDVLRLIQNKMIELLNTKNIAIEALPSSNVRISHYKSYSEYHLMRWLGLRNENDPLPTVVVGSDDTGIFMTNLKNEYSHVFKLINDKYGTTKAVAAVEQLHKNSKAYGFH